MNRNAPAVVFLFLLLLLPSFLQAAPGDPKTSTYAKAKSLIIDEITFDKLSLEAAVAFFQEQSLALDPEKKGLNFILKKDGSEEPSVTLNLRKIPLSEVLKYISSLTNYQVKYEEHAIILIPPEPVKKS